MVKYNFILTILALAAVDVCASTMKSKAGKPNKGVYLSAMGGVSFGSKFNSLKVDGKVDGSTGTAVAIIRGGTLDASSSDDNGLVVNNNGEAYVCKADLIKGGTTSTTSTYKDGLPGVLLSDPQASTPNNPNSRISIVNARIEGGNGVDNGFGGKGLVVNRGQADIVSKKSSIVGGLYPDGTSRGAAIELGTTSANLYVYGGHIGDAITRVSLCIFNGFAYIYGGKWLGNWKIFFGTVTVYGNLVHDNDKLTGTLCDGNEIDIEFEFRYFTGNFYIVQNCDDYEHYVTNTLPYTECE